MLNIIICDDEEIIRKDVELSLKKISIKHDLDLKCVLSTGDPDKVYNYASENKTDILLLDIDLKTNHMDGIDLGNKLRKIDKNIIIVFLSSRMDKMPLSFTCNPFDFIPKPSINPHLEETLVRIHENKLHTPHGHFTKIKNAIINLDELIYVEKQVTKSIFYTTINTIELYISFLELLSCLTDNFIQISKSYIVNRNHIVCVHEKTKTIILKNKQELKYSTKFLPDLGGIQTCKI